MKIVSYICNLCGKSIGEAVAQSNGHKCSECYENYRKVAKQAWAEPNKPSPFWQSVEDAAKLLEETASITGIVVIRGTNP